MPAPGQFLPRKSGAHRIACIALYRALLIQCSKIPLPQDLVFPGPVNPIKHFIRKRFKKNVFHTSARIVVPALKTGYAAEALLRSAAEGNGASISQIHSLLRLIHAQSSASRAANPPELKAARKAKRPSRPEPWPGAPKLMDVRPRPIEDITGGRRKVPKVVLAQWIPFLRVRKPQSEYLGRVIRDKKEQQQRRMNRLERLEWDVEMGEAEDEWDGMVREMFNKEEEWGGEFDDDLDEKEIEGEREKRQMVSYKPFFGTADGTQDAVPAPTITLAPSPAPSNPTFSIPQAQVPKKSEIKKALSAQHKATATSLKAITEDNPGMEKPWMAEPFLVRGNIQWKLARTYSKAFELSRNMLIVADREKELAEKERRERRHEKRLEGWRRKEEKGWVRAEKGDDSVEGKDVKENPRWVKPGEKQPDQGKTKKGFTITRNKVFR